MLRKGVGILGLIWLVLSVAGCGQKGPLYFPKETSRADAAAVAWSGLTDRAGRSGIVHRV